jgi:hypothetical protein
MRRSVYDYIRDGQPREHPSISKKGKKFISFSERPNRLRVSRSVLFSWYRVLFPRGQKNHSLGLGLRLRMTGKLNPHPPVTSWISRGWIYHSYYHY